LHAKSPVKLTESDHRYLTTLLSKGQLSARRFRRATALLELHRGHTLDEVAQTLAVHPVTVANWRDVYKEVCLQCLQDKPRQGRLINIDGRSRAQITALACTSPPQGRARWSLRLLADKAVELGYYDRLSHTQARTIFKKTPSSRTSSALGVSSSAR
jgi:transposase